LQITRDRLASSGSGYIIIWDIYSGSCLFRYDNKNGHPYNNLIRFSENKFISIDAYFEENINIWNSSNGDILVKNSHIMSSLDKISLIKLK